MCSFMKKLSARIIRTLYARLPIKDDCTAFNIEFATFAQSFFFVNMLNNLDPYFGFH